MRRCIFLLTDFGVADTLVGEMKAVIAGMCEAEALDLTHSVRPGDARHAAFLLSNSLDVLPEGSITVAVIDPGVGSARRVLLAEAAGRLCLAPDNGLLPLALAEAPAVYRQVSEPALSRATVSSTFHGRDIFAPVAARLAAGLPAAQVGPMVEPQRPLAPLAPSPLANGEYSAEVIHVDRFGNLVTVYDVRRLPPVEAVVLAGRTVPFMQRGYYAAVAAGEPLAYEGSHGYLEIAVNRSSAAGIFGIRAGQSVLVKAAGGTRRAGSP